MPEQRDRQDSTDENRKSRFRLRRGPDVVCLGRRLLRPRIAARQVARHAAVVSRWRDRARLGGRAIPVCSFEFKDVLN